MAQRTDSERLKQALQTLHEARTEISAEARWLREELDPRRAAHRVVDKHTTGVLLTTFAVGLGAAWLLFRKRPHEAPPPRRREREPQPVPEKKPAKGGMVGTLLKLAMPLLFKYATSPTVVNHIMGRWKDAVSHRARSMVS